MWQYVLGKRRLSLKFAPQQCLSIPTNPSHEFLLSHELIGRLTHPENSFPGPQRAEAGVRHSDDAGGLYYPVRIVSRLLDDICDTEDALTFLLLVPHPPLAPPSMFPSQERRTVRASLRVHYGKARVRARCSACFSHAG